MSHAPSQRPGSLQRRLSAKGESLYCILDVEKGAPLEEIKKKYRQLALKYHPDKNPNNPEATERFIEINNANNILQDEKKKEIYDRYGSLGLYIGEQIGYDNLKTYFALQSPLAKFLAGFCCLITGCCFCCCCCFCCNFCCGKCRPEDHLDEEDLLNINPEDLIDKEDESTFSHPVVDQPQSSASSNFNISEETTNENVPLTSAEYPIYQTHDGE